MSPLVKHGGVAREPGVSYSNTPEELVQDCCPSLKWWGDPQDTSIVEFSTNENASLLSDTAFAKSYDDNRVPVNPSRPDCSDEQRRVRRRSGSDSSLKVLGTSVLRSDSIWRRYCSSGCGAADDI